MEKFRGSYSINFVMLLAKYIWSDQSVSTKVSLNIIYIAVTWFVCAISGRIVVIMTVPSQ